MIIPLTTSTRLVPIPAIGDAVVLTPSSYSGWAAMFAANPDKEDYLLTPGDYRGWGIMHVNDRSGTAQRPRTIRYHNPVDRDEGVHPYHRKNHARIGQIRFHGDGPLFGKPTGTKFANYWIVQGLTNLSQPLTETVWTVYAAADHVTFDFCYIADAQALYGIRNFCNHTTVQRCVFARSVRDFGVDSVGFGTCILLGIPVTGSRMLDCEVFDWGDAFGATEGGDPNFTELDFLVEGCDFYQTGAKYFNDGLNCDAENGVDIKLGSDTVQSVIRNCRMWGFRGNTVSSPGDVMTLHRACRNLLIEDNILGDAPIGIRAEVWPAGYEDPHRNRYITARRNRIYGIRQFVPIGSQPGAIQSAAFHPAVDVVANDNLVADCDYVIPHAPSGGYRAGGPTFSGNIRVSSAIQPPGDVFACPYSDSDNVVEKRTGSAIIYERRRWTGPEFGYLPGRPRAASHRGF